MSISCQDNEEDNITLRRTVAASRLAKSENLQAMINGLFQTQIDGVLSSTWVYWSLL